MKSRLQGERGAVSLFIVIFSALLISIITVTFVRTMVEDQLQATTSDLSKSALDSAQAGVEDAKRAIVMYRSQCQGANVATAECIKLARALTDGTHCDTIQQSGILSGVNPGDKEVLVKQTEGDKLLDQAYTCVKVQLNTVDYVGSLTPNTSRLVPLKSDQPFNQITIEWYSQKDIQTDLTGSASGSKVDLGLDTQLPKLADWPKNRPALMRVQLMQFGSSFNLSDFDDNKNGTSDNASLFLVPSTVGRDTMSFADDIRKSQVSEALEQVRCDQNFSATSTDSQYACKATIQLPNPIGETDGNNRHAYLRVSEFYNTNTSFRVTMQNNTDVTLFSAVQPAVDSTGRANDYFRRILSRVELEASSIPNIEAAVDITGSLCKTFLVTDQVDDYNPGICQDTTSSP